MASCEVLLLSYVLCLSILHAAMVVAVSFPRGASDTRRDIIAPFQHPWPFPRPTIRPLWTFPRRTWAYDARPHLQPGTWRAWLGRVRASRTGLPGRRLHSPSSDIWRLAQADRASFSG